MLDIFTLENRKKIVVIIKNIVIVKILTTFSHVLFPVGQPRLPHSWLWAWEHQWNPHRDCCIFPVSSSACCPSGAGIDPPSCVPLRDPAPKMSKWLWRKQKRESEYGKQRAFLGSAWIWLGDQKKSKVRRGKMSLQVWYGVGDWLVEGK